MSRSAADILKSMLSRLVPGFALGRRGGYLDQVFAPAAHVLAEAEAGASALMDEIDPRSATVLLADFERLLGPDPCQRDLGPLTFEQRQRIAHQRWTARGDQSIPYFLSIAAKLGIDIEIEEFWPSRAGVLRAGQRLVGEGGQFTWRVTLQATRKIIFKAGAGRAGNRLVEYGLTGVECVLQRYKPAHTQILFTYVNRAILTLDVDGVDHILTFTGWDDEDYILIGDI